MSLRLLKKINQDSFITVFRRW